MPEIGPSLREARMRARIDITEVEEATKIRAKYLRALENEEWGLLPGSVFVKSFLREYANYLDLDARALVEEYKLRHEGPSEHELVPISPNLGGDRRGRGSGSDGPMLPRWVIVAGALVLVVVALGLVGSLGGSGKGGDTGATSKTTQSRTTGTTPRRTHRAPALPARASVRIVPTGTIYVCLVDQRGKVLIPGTQFAAGQQVPIYRARSMRMTLGNNELQLHVNGRAVTVPASSTAISYELRPDGAHPLALDQAPTCT